METRGLLARVAVVGTTVASVGVAFAPAASAGNASVDKVDGVSTNVALNNATRTLTITGASQYVPAVPSITVTLTRHASSATEDQLQITNATAAADTHTITAAIDFTRANPGLYDLTVAQGPSTDSCTSCVEVTGFRPRVDSVSPAVLGEGTTGGGFQNFVITGSNFAKGLYQQCATSTCDGPSVAIYRTGTTNSDSNVTLTQTTTNGSPSPTATTLSTITLRINVADANIASSYADDVVVFNSAASSQEVKSYRCTGCLTIKPGPSISSVTLIPTAFPSTPLTAIGQNATGQTVVVRGDNFPSDAVVSFERPTGAGNTEAISYAQPANPPQADGTHQKITLTGVNTTGVTTPGNWTTVVSSPVLHASSAPSIFPVTAKPVADTANGINYLDGTLVGYGQGARDARLLFNVSGGKFYGGSGTTPHTVVRILSPPTGLSGGPQTATDVPAGDDTVAVSLDIPPGATTGGYQFQVLNPDGGTSDVCDNSSPGTAPPLTQTPNTCVFTITTGPTVTSIDPNTKAPGFSGNVDVIGTGFHTGAGKTHVRIGSATAPIFDQDTNATTTTKITVPLTIPAGTPTPANLDVVVTNVDDQGIGTGAGLFHVTTLTAGNPVPAAQTNDDKYPVTLTGNNIAQSATIKMVKTGVPDINGTNVSVNQAGTSITATFDLTNKAPGKYDVLVTNPSGSHAGTGGCSQCFTVQANAPVLTTVSPASMGGGAVNEVVTATGSDIYPGATLVFSNTHVHAVGTSTVTAPGSLSQRISIDEGTAPESGTVKVMNSDGQVSGTKAFAITAGPAPSGISPTKHAAGSAPFQLVVSGTNFVNGATLAFSNSSITASNATVTGNSLTATVTIPASVAAGGASVPVHVTVVNPDKGRGTSPTDLTVTPAPAISEIKPAGGAPGSSVPVQILGSGFANDATVTGGSGLSVTGTKVVSPGEIDATVDVASDAAIGDHSIKVTNGDGGADSHKFVVFTLPGKPGNVDVIPGDGSLKVAWTAPADNGGDPVTSYRLELTKHSDGSTVKVFITFGSTLSHRFKSLTNGVRYDVAVAAANGAGAGPAATGSGRPKFVTTLTLRRSDNEVPIGHAVRLSGGLTRSDGSGIDSAKIRIYRKFAGHHRTLLDTRRTNGTGHWTLKIHPKRTATYTAKFGGDRADRRDSSPSRSVRVT